MKRRISLLMGLLYLIASMSVVAAPPSKLIDGKISGQETCWQELCGFAHFFGTYNGKVSSEHTTGSFSVFLRHEDDLKTTPGEVTNVFSDNSLWFIWTSMGNFAGTIKGGTLTAKKNDRFDVNIQLLITKPEAYSNVTLTFIGVLDHSGLKKEPIPELPTIMGDIYSN